MMSAKVCVANNTYLARRYLTKENLKNPIPPFNNQEKFEQFLQNDLSKNVFRAKGILWFEESDLRNIFQLSGPRFSIDGEEWCSPPRNQLVFIGRHLNGDHIQQQLTDCLA